MKLVCLDSMYFIWGLLKRATPSQEGKIEQAEEFLKKLDSEDATIIVPTPLLQELLMDCDSTERDAILSVLKGNFVLTEFDTASARIAAKIWNDKKRAKVIDEIRKSGDSMRTKIKIDVQIIAVACSQQASVLYTNDAKLAKMAEDYIQTADMPSFKKQLEFELRPNSASSTGSPPPSSQSPTAPRMRAIEREPSRPSAPQADQEQPPPGSFPEDPA